MYFLFYFSIWLLKINLKKTAKFVFWHWLCSCVASFWMWQTKCFKTLRSYGNWLAASLLHNGNWLLAASLVHIQTIHNNTLSFLRSKTSNIDLRSGSIGRSSQSQFLMPETSQWKKKVLMETEWFFVTNLMYAWGSVFKHTLLLFSFQMVVQIYNDRVRVLFKMFIGWQFANP